MSVGLWSGENLDVDHAQLTKKLIQMKLLSHMGQDEMIPQDSGTPLHIEIPPYHH
jgi:hypothetical protein